MREARTEKFGWLLILFNGMPFRRNVCECVFIFNTHGPARRGCMFAINIRIIISSCSARSVSLSLFAPYPRMFFGKFFYVIRVL
jgi:hypothetical protein